MIVKLSGLDEQSVMNVITGLHALRNGQGKDPTDVRQRREGGCFWSGYWPRALQVVAFLRILVTPCKYQGVHLKFSWGGVIQVSSSQEFKRSHRRRQDFVG